MFDVVSMSLFTQTELPDLYFVCLINTDLMSLYVDNFINNTSHFQINDARQTPIIIPTKEQLYVFQHIFQQAQTIQKEVFAMKKDIGVATNELQQIQSILENRIKELYSI